jgi:hypothetical protein
LCISIQAKLNDLKPEISEQYDAKNDASDYLNLFQKVQVKALRSAFEDN